MKIIALAAVGIFAANMAMADAHAGCENMLTAAIGAQLSAQGIDTTNICSLTLADLVTIKSLLDNDGMNSSTVGRINVLLGN